MKIVLNILFENPFEWAATPKAKRKPMAANLISLNPRVKKNLPQKPPLKPLRKNRKNPKRRKHRNQRKMTINLMYHQSSLPLHLQRSFLLT